jgi:hypothetical protein
MSGERPVDLPRISHAAIPQDAWLVVRGVASIEPETSLRQAELFRRRFEQWGRYGLSAFCARSVPFYGDVENGVARLLAVTHRIVSNPAYRQEES